MEEEILRKSKGVVHYAANKFQWNIVEGLINSNEVNLDIISAPNIGSYPKDYKDLYFKKRNTLKRNKLTCKFVGFNNFWGYRNISRKNAVKKEIKDYVSKPVSNKVIIVYSTHTPLLQAAVYAKKIDSSIHICLVVPDLPQYMNLNDKKSFLYSKLKKLDIKVFESYVKEVDSFVLLTEHMATALNIDQKPYVVIEGLVDAQTEPLKIKDSSNEISIVYTGTLNRKFGVENLVRAFSAIKRSDISLKICGKGDAEEVIKKLSIEDPRIHYLGQLSNDKAIELQRNATILVNPRQNTEEFTKYSFPSKNMEYLLSGNPLIAYKLDGVPKEYNDFIVYPLDNSIKELSTKIEEVLKIPKEKRLKHGEKTRKFLLENKNNDVAALRILKMIKK